MPSNDPSTSPTRLSRRALLRRGSQASVVLGSVGVCGCMESIPVLDSATEPIAVPPADPPDYRSWLPAPSALADQLELDPGHIVHGKPKQSDREDVDGLFTFPEMMVASQADWFGHEYSHYDRAITIDRAVVLEGAIDRSAVDSAISGTAYESAGSYEEYDLYGRSDVRRTLAVGDDTLVFSSDEHSEQNVKAVIDAGNGRIERYHESDGDFDRVLDETGERQFNWFTPTDTELIEAISIGYDEESVYHVTHRLYADEADFSERELEQEFESGGWDIDPEGSSVHSDGRLATVVQQFDRESSLRTTTEHDWPQVTWGIDYDEDADTVTIRHEAGEPVDADSLSVSYRRPSEGREAETQFADEYQTVEAGDDLMLDLSTGDDVRQVHLSYSPGRDAKSLLLDYRIDQ